MKEVIQNHGFQPDEIIEGDHYVLGAHTKLGEKVLMPGGHGWGEFLTNTKELQHRKNLETFNCTNYGTLNNWEILGYFKFGVKFDWSERYTGVGTGTSPSGNTPHKVAEIIRTEIGLIPEELLPFDESVHTWDDYYSPNPMIPELLAMGRKFLSIYRLGHEWVFVGGTLKQKQEKMTKALQYSPLGVSVLAWKQRNGLYWKDVGEDDSHWCTVYDFEKGKKWFVLDHYDDTTKELEWNYDFGFCKRYSIEKIVLTEEAPEVKKKSFADAISEWLRRIFNWYPQEGQTRTI